jgi:hypothetical protein
MIASGDISAEQCQGSSGQGGVHIHALINANVTVQGPAGTPEQNEHLAKQFGQQLDTIVRSTPWTRSSSSAGPGNLLNQ